MNPSLPDIAFFHQLAELAKKQTLPRFRSSMNLHVDIKPKEGIRFDPVTDADREAEQVMRQLINERYPAHAILGEEFGLTGEGTTQWVLDPVDGTRPFLCGLPIWGTLIGLQQHGRAIMGMMSQPYTGESFWSDGKQAWASNAQGQIYSLHTRKNIALEQAILHTTSPEPIEHHPSIHFTSLAERVLMTRYGGECYAMAMLAAGQIDICFEYSLQPYDIVALIPIIEQAGGVVTTLAGERAEAGGAILASGCPKLHQQALAILTGKL